MYRRIRRARKFLFFLGLISLLLHVAAPDRVPLWIVLTLFGGWLAAFGYGLFHVAMTRRTAYACPYCGWVPYALDAWKCKGCGKRVDVFRQMGICSRCGHQHEEFMCLRCRGVAARPRWLRLS
ncbi:MAG: hypothetical protein NZM31_04475 [Gemmatales bacterium]|nr:hypothetical protein [Gemmatales bacterium]MDW8386256.1 hypothetical protein [Gemmatales bacterium]